MSPSSGCDKPWQRPCAGSNPVEDQKATSAQHSPARQYKRACTLSRQQLPGGESPGVACVANVLRSASGLRQLLGSEVPVQELVDDCIDVIGAPVLVIEVI